MSQFAQTSSITFTAILVRIIVNLMPSQQVQAIKLLLNRGEPVVLSHVFPVFLVEVLIVLARELSETCAEVVECSPQQKSTVDGIEKSM
jgi:hypothetical protein